AVDNIQNAAQGPRRRNTSVFDWNICIGNLDAFVLRYLAKDSPICRDYLCVFVNFSFVGEIDEGSYSSFDESTNSLAGHFRIDFGRIFSRKKLIRRNPVRATDRGLGVITHRAEGYSLGFESASN